MHITPRRLTAGLLALALLLAACGGDSGDDGSNQTPTPETTAPVSTSSNAAVAATATPALAPDRIQLQTGVSTQYYTVQALTTQQIFREIDTNGLTDSAGHKALGLTVEQSNYTFTRVVNARTRECAIASMTISTNITITVPRHANVAALPPNVQTSWQGFAAAILAHEQKHVDIAVAGAKRVQEKLMATGYASSCEVLDGQINSIWSTERATTAAAQDTFHVQDEARVAGLRGPLQSRIEGNRGRITDLDAQITGIEAIMTYLNTEIEKLRSQIGVLKTELDNTPPSDEDHEKIRKQHNDRVAEYNVFVDSYNTNIDKRNSLAEERTALIAGTNLLIESLNWLA